MTYVTSRCGAKRRTISGWFATPARAPRVTQTVGVVKTDFLKKNPDMIRGIIEARRKGVEFIMKNPDESAAALAKEYKIEPVRRRAAIDDILSAKGVYWSPRRFRLRRHERMLKGLQLVKAVEPGRSTGRRLSTTAICRPTEAQAEVTSR